MCGCVTPGVQWVAVSSVRPAAPVCVETDASSWRGFLLWTHSSPGLLGCFRVVYTVQYSVYSVQCTAQLCQVCQQSSGQWMGGAGTWPPRILLLCAGSCSKWATWLVREITGTIFTQQFSTVQHTLYYTVHAFFGSEDNVVWSHLTNLILHFHVLVFIMIVL